MKSTVETLSPTRVRLAVEVPFAELEPSLKKVYKEIGSKAIPGFRKGRVPPAIIDQRVGRGVVLDAAAKDAIPSQLLAAVQEHEVKTLGLPDVKITEFVDGQPLRFTAEVDVRPAITLPPLEEIQVTVDAITVSEDDVEEQIKGLRERFSTLKTVERAALRGDYIQLDLAATVDGTEVPGGTASNISHEVGSGQLLLGLDEVLEGRLAGESTSFKTELVAGEYADREADVSVTVRAVKEKQLPDLDDDFAQMASEFDTLDELRGDLRTRLSRAKRIEQLYTARDRALQALVEASDVPAPAGVVREEVEHRRETMTDQLEKIGASLEEYLAVEGRTAEEIDAELIDAATEGVRIQLVLDTFAEAERVQVTEEEFGAEIMHQAQRAGVPPQQFYDQLIRAGMAGAIFGDVRRRKALALILDRVKIADSAGNVLNLAELSGAAGAGATDDAES